MPESNLIIITGQEGSGKSTIVRALLEVTSSAAQIDAEDVGTVNPWKMDDDYIDLLHANVAVLARNFWDAGYRTVIAGSFMSNYTDYERFITRQDHPANVYLIHFCAAKLTRDQRRIEREKPSRPEWRDMVDRGDPEDQTLYLHASDYRYVRIDNDDLSVAKTVAMIQHALPEIYG